MTLVTLQDLENSLKINQLIKSQSQMPNTNTTNDHHQQHLNFMLQNASVTKANLFTSALMMQHLQNQNKSLILQSLHSNSSSSSSKTPSECGSGQKGQVNSGRYKTELCRQFIENGGCKYGDKCQFAHGSPDLKDVNRHPKYKTDYCRTFHSKGFCPYGPRCHFVHEFNEKFNESLMMEGSKKMNKNCVNSSNSSQNLQLEAIQNRIQSNLFVTENHNHNHNHNNNNNTSSNHNYKSLNQCDDLNSSFLSSSSPPISPMPMPRTRSGMSSTSSLNSSTSSYDLTQSDRSATFSPLTRHQSSSQTFNLPISKNLVQIGRNLITEKFAATSHDQAALNQQIINIERLNDLLNSNQLNFCNTGRQQATTW